MSITHSQVVVAPDSTGPAIDNVDVNSKKRQVVALGSPQSTGTEQIADVMASQPAGSEQGLVVREAQKGQQASANSQPVVIASDQSSIPVTVGSIALPTGAATEASLGTDGAAPPSIPGTGIRGWLRSIYDRLVTGLARTWTLSSGADSVSVGNFPATQPISAASLPLPTGAATAAKQPALGTAGTPSADVISVQGEAGMTALKVDGSAVTQPISAVSLPLPTGGATEATLATRTKPSDQQHTIVDSGTLGLAAGTQKIGQVAIDQTTPGTTNLIQVGGSLPAGANIIGKVTTDSTTHGVTDLVAADITKVGGAALSEGQTLMLNSLPVTMASDQIDNVLRARRQMEELRNIELFDSAMQMLARRHVEKSTATDRRGSAGRGSTR